MTEHQSAARNAPHQVDPQLLAICALLIDPTNARGPKRDQAFCAATVFLRETVEFAADFNSLSAEQQHERLALGDPDFGAEVLGVPDSLVLDLENPSCPAAVYYSRQIGAYKRRPKGILPIARALRAYLGESSMGRTIGAMIKAKKGTIDIPRKLLDLAVDSEKQTKRGKQMKRRRP